jgi:hypothetical protein
MDMGGMMENAAVASETAKPSASSRKIKEINLMITMEDGRTLPVVQVAALADLFPDRSLEQFQALKQTILETGQIGKCLYCLWDNGNSLLLIDGRDTSRAIGQLRNDGRPVDVAWELYTPIATDRDKILLELMAIVIRRKLLQTAVKLDVDSKESAILAFLKNCYAIGDYRTSNWIASDLGCSETWVTKVRNKAIAQRELPVVPEYRTRNGKPWPVSTKRGDPFKETTVIPISTSLASRTEDEIMEDAEARREGAAATVKKTFDLVDKIIADPGSVIGPALPSPVDDNAPLPDPSSEADVRGGDDDSGERTDVDEELEAVYEWKASLHTPDDFDDNEIRWMFYAGFFNVETLGEQTTVSLVDKDQFLKLVTSKLAPLVKYYGGDPITLESAIAGVLNSSKPATKSKSKPKS